MTALVGTLHDDARGQRQGPERAGTARAWMFLPARAKKIRHKDGSDRITTDATRRRSFRTASHQNVEPACYEMRFAHFRQRFGSLRDAPDFL